MSNNLLGVAGFTADKVAKSFSVNEHGHINVAGDIKGAIIGSVVEPYGENYSGVVAVMGRQVHAGAEIESLSTNCRYLGSSGNRLFFQTDAGGNVLVTNLNLQPVDSYTLPENLSSDGAYRAKIFAKDGYFVYSTADGNVYIKTDRFEDVLQLDKEDIHSVLIHNNMVIKTENKTASNPNPKLSFYALPTGNLVKTMDIVAEIVEPITDGVVGLFFTQIVAEGDKLVLTVGTGAGQQDVTRTLNIIDLKNYSVIEGGLVPVGYSNPMSLEIHDGIVYYIPFNTYSIGRVYYMNIDNPADSGLTGIAYRKTANNTTVQGSFISGGILSISNLSTKSREPSRILYKDKMQDVAAGAQLYNWSTGRDHLGRIVMCTNGYAMILSEELVLKGYRVVE